MKKKPLFLLFAPAGLGLILLLSQASSWAQDLSYDKYTSALRETPGLSKTQKGLLHFPVYPFEMVRYPIDKSLIAIEKYRIDQKVHWIYDYLQNHGINPELNLLSAGQLSVGTDVDFVRACRLKEVFPDAVAGSWIHYANHDFFEVGSQIGMERIANTGLELKGFFNYADRGREHFFGIGPHSSRGDSSVYDREETVLEALSGYKFDFKHKLNFSFAYHNVNISDGRNEGSAQFGQHPTFANAPGLHGDEFLSFKTQFERDSRNQKENSTAGGQHRFAFSFNEGLNSSQARFLKYELESSKYFRLGSDRRVLAIHGYGEYNSQLDGKIVPFHQMARVGGYGSAPDLSHALRAFDTNRFTDDAALLFNIEYRYTIWEYRDFKTDAVFFLDEGQAFKKLSRFKFSDFRGSYGTGLRTSLANIVFLSVEVAHGDEGTSFYVRTSTPF